jgi:hypothetical protein
MPRTGGRSSRSSAWFPKLEIRQINQKPAAIAAGFFVSSTLGTLCEEHHHAVDPI